jgi:hypothetical protein
MLAAKGRAGGATARSALLQPTEPKEPEQPKPEIRPEPKAQPTPPRTDQPESADTVARLREAKQRARDREARDHG